MRLEGIEINNDIQKLNSKLDNSDSNTCKSVISEPHIITSSTPVVFRGSLYDEFHTSSKLEIDISDIDAYDIYGDITKLSKPVEQDGSIYNIIHKNLELLESQQSTVTRNINDYEIIVPEDITGIYGMDTYNTYYQPDLSGFVADKLVDSINQRYVEQKEKELSYIEKEKQSIVELQRLIDNSGDVGNLLGLDALKNVLNGQINGHLGIVENPSLAVNDSIQPINTQLSRLANEEPIIDSIDKSSIDNIFSKSDNSIPVEDIVGDNQLDLSVDTSKSINTISVDSKTLVQVPSINDIMPSTQSITPKTVVGNGITKNNYSPDYDELQKDFDDYCIYCGNTGRTKENPWECSHCGKHFKELSGMGEKSYAELKGVYIPELFRKEEYRFITETVLDVIRSKQKFEPVQMQKAWVEVLNLAIGKIRDKILKGGQTIIHSEYLLEKTLYMWAYTALDVALGAGYSTTHLINAYTINIDNFTNMYDDILFLELSKYKLRETMEKLELICSIRRNLDKPTFIITKVRLKDINDTGVEIIDTVGINSGRKVDTSGNLFSYISNLTC